MARKQPRAPRRNKKKSRTGGRRLIMKALLVAKLFGAAVAVALTSCGFILVYDLVVQCGALPVAQITVEGQQRLSADAIVRRAGVAKGDNILAVNLSKLRRRLITHPWIAEAQVRREIPSGIRIRIREHQALAVVDLGGGFLLNPDGCLFKAWEPDADPPQLPTVKGVAVSDVTVAGMPPERSESGWPARAEAAAGDSAAVAPMAAVMQVLRLGREPGSALPNRLIRTIQVDPEMGLTLWAFDPPKTIGLGYGDYPEKYRVLARLRRDRRVPDFTHIDLQEINRIVIKPAGDGHQAAGS